MAACDWSRHSPYSDPGRYAALLDAVPTDVPSLSAVARNVIVYQRQGEAFQIAPQPVRRVELLQVMLRPSDERPG